MHEHQVKFLFIFFFFFVQVARGKEILIRQQSFNTCTRTSSMNAHSKPLHHHTQGQRRARRTHHSHAQAARSTSNLKARQISRCEADGLYNQLASTKLYRTKRARRTKRRRGRGGVKHLASCFLPQAPKPIHIFSWEQKRLNNLSSQRRKGRGSQSSDEE